MEIIYVRAIVQLLRNGNTHDALVVALYLLALMEHSDIQMDDMNRVGSILQSLIDNGFDT